MAMEDRRQDRPGILDPPADARPVAQDRSGERDAGRAASDRPDIARLIDELQSLHDSERAAVALVGCGRAAVPALRRVVFAREPSGLYRARCLAVQALALLGAHDVLVEFLTLSPRAIADPIERAGEDAVINAAARGLAGVRDEAVFRLLLRLATQPSLAGVLEALGEYRRPEAIPWLVAALGDDLGRTAAEEALRKLGPVALPALLRAATTGPSAHDDEGESGLRRRRSALSLLGELGEPCWPALRGLIHDEDGEIAFLACRIGLDHAPLAERETIVERLIELLGRVPWLLGAEIEDCLVAHFAAAHRLVARALAAQAPAQDDDHAAARRREALLRIRTRATGESVPAPTRP
jgi:hypothetical protein